MRIIIISGQRNADIQKALQQLNLNDCIQYPEFGVMFWSNGCAAPFSKLFPVESDKLGEFNISNEYIDLETVYEDCTKKVVYDKNTKVMYLIVNGYSYFGITPIYNADGTVKLYDGE